MNSTTPHADSVMRTGILAALALGLACAPPPAGERIEVFLPPGASMEAIAESLAVHGVVRSAKAFSMYASMSGTADSIAPGVYFLEARPLGELLPVLRRGPELGKLTIPEGAMTLEVAASVERALGTPVDSFLAAIRDQPLRERVEARGETLEGYLYPTTYYVPLDVTARDLVARMVHEFERRWRPEWMGKARALEWSRDELVTLASIVSGETRDDNDRPLVASVYRNRLERGMRLQADPTVVYGLGERRRLTNRDYRLESRYNTYLIDGLPPHPISQPSTASIEAVLDYVPTDFLYFVAGADGKHVFSETYGEHLAAIRRIRRGSAAAEEPGQ
jgi:UPF0755 protein